MVVHRKVKPSPRKKPEKPAPRPEPTVPDDLVVLTQPRGKRQRHPCGFCATRHHSLCPGQIANADPTSPGRLWKCTCAQADPDLHPRYHGERR